MAPMTRKRSENGILSNNIFEYYKRRADGGVGMIFSEGTFIDHPAAGIYNNDSYKNIPHFYGKEALKSWSKLVKIIHKSGTLIIPQLWHVGEIRNNILNGNIGIGPRNIFYKNQKVVRKMQIADFKAVIKSFVRAAYNAQELGFDGVALHGAHGYLFDQFFWEKTNNRKDKYGESIINKTRFAAEVINEIKNKVAKNFPLVFRFSQWKMNDYNAKIVKNYHELTNFLNILTESGVDYFDVSTRRFWEPAFGDNSKSLVALTKSISKKPVFAVGSVGLDQPHQSKFFRDKANIDAKVTDIKKVLKQLNNNDFDFVSVGRAILADPEWPNKIKNKKINDIKPFVRKDLENYF